MQAIYYPTKYISLQANETFYLKCNHDEYSLWFNVFTKKEVEEAQTKCLDMRQPFEYSLVSRSRLLQINDKTRNSMFADLLRMVSAEGILITKLR
jgi:protein arginine N-methyltransferase 7